MAKETEVRRTEEVKRIMRILQRWITPALLALAGAAQQPEKTWTADEQARRAVRDTQEALIQAHPDLEKDLHSAPVAALRLQVTNSRQLANKYVTAKLKYYEQMAGRMAGELDRMQSLSLTDPAALQRHVEAARNRMDLMREEVRMAQAQVDTAKSRGEAASASEVEHLNKQVAVAQHLANLHESEVADLEALRLLTSEAEQRRAGLVDRKKAERDIYRELQSLVKASAGHYQRYYDALDRVLDQRENKKPAPVAPQKGK